MEWVRLERDVMEYFVRYPRRPPHHRRGGEN